MLKYKFNIAVFFVTGFPPAQAKREVKHVPMFCPIIIGMALPIVMLPELDKA